MTEVEGYPGLIVHGPLIATLLMDLLRRQLPDADVATLPLQGGAADLRPPPVPRQRRLQDDGKTVTPVGAGPRRLADDGRHRHAALNTRQEPPCNRSRALTVVTLEHAIAAPFATRQLADLGARVIKIERPGVGDFARGYDAARARPGLALRLDQPLQGEPDARRQAPRGREGARATGPREGRRRGAEPGAGRGGAAGPGLRGAGGDEAGASSSATSPAMAPTARTATRRPTTC